MSQAKTHQLLSPRENITPSQTNQLSKTRMDSSTDPSPTPEALPAPILTLPNTIIRPLHPSDAAAICKHGNDPDISKWMCDTFPSPYLLAHAHAFLTTIGLTQTMPAALCPAASPVPQHYALCRRADGAYMGGLGLMPKADVQARTLEIGYWVGREFWGNGYASEAVRALAAWAFAHFPDVLRIEGEVFEGNEGSARVLLKAGFRAEGIRRKAVYKEGRSLDLLYFGMLRCECVALREGGA